MAAEAPSAQIGRRSALEMDTPERTTQTASRNVVALKNRMGHQVDADGKLRRGSWQVDGGQIFPGCNAGSGRRAGEPIGSDISLSCDITPWWSVFPPATPPLNMRVRDWS